MAVSAKPTRGRAHFLIPKESAFAGIAPEVFGVGVSFRHFLSKWGAIVVSPQVLSLHQTILAPCSDSSSAITKNSFAPKTTAVLLLTAFSICPFDILEEIRSKFDVEKESIDFFSERISSPYYCFP